MRFLRRFQRRYASCFQSKTAALEKKKKSYNKLLCGHSERHSVDTGNGYSSIQLGHEHSTDDAPLSEHHRVGIPREPIGLFVYTSSKNTQVVHTRARDLGRRLTTTTLTHLSLKTRECRERERQIRGWRARYASSKRPPWNKVDLVLKRTVCGLSSAVLLRLPAAVAGARRG